MTRLARYMAIAATAAASALAPPALANEITFETAPLGGGFTGPVTEDGFTYSTLSGGLFVNDFGNPGRDMEGQESVGGGVLKIARAGGGNFTFDDVDFSAFDTSGTGTQTLKVEGFLGASAVATDQYTLADTSSAPFTNWTTEATSALAGKTFSELDIALNAGESPTVFRENIDNVVLAPIPEPTSLALLAAGILALGWFRRRWKQA